MILLRLHNIGEIANAAADVAFGRYPRFVYGLPCSAESIPLFTFHKVEPWRFESQLAFLRDNGYKTLTCDDLLKVVKGKRPHAAREVMLTFDDGWASLWTVAYPLLKRYGLQATAFVVPGLIPDVAGLSPNLEDVWGGTHSLGDLAGLDDDSHDLATWPEIVRMHESGVIDVQSHALSHSLMFVSPQLVDFANPELVVKSYGPHELSHLGEELLGETPAWGCPLYRSASRMGEHRRYYGDSGLRQACIDYVAGHGGVEFFQSRGWRRNLLQVVKTYRRMHVDEGFFEGDAQREDAIREELLESRRMLEERLPGKRVEHLCYPWGQGSELAVTLSGEVGYSTNFWCHVNRGYTTNTSTNPYYIARISEQFLLMLSGKRRMSLARVALKRTLERLLARSSSATH